MLTLRPYQAEAVQAVYKHLAEKDNNPCVVTPTASGKSIMIAQIATDAVTRWNGRVLVLAHVKELLEQNADKVRRLCDGIPVGIYSAGLKSRDTDTPVLVAGIQSVYNKADQLGKFDLCIIDEAHLIAPDGEGMYRTFLAAMKEINPLVRIIGFTATPFRMKGGLICKPENILNEICYEVGIKEMIRQGYLSPLTSKAGRAEADLSNVHIRGGEFIADEAEAAMDTDSLVLSACHEIADLTKARKSVLIFATSIKHCEHIARVLTEWTHEECAVVTGSTPAIERAEILDRFRGNAVCDMFGDVVKKPLKYLCNVNVLTTGFDAPNTDCIVLLRPTNSPGLLIQMVGRGFRLSPETGKRSCLVLDYGENILRHGPIDCIRVRDKTTGHGEAPAKKCPQCYALIHAAYSVCPECGYEFPINRQSNISANASKAGIISGEITYEEYPVKEVQYEVHYKKNASSDVPATMQVIYRVGLYQRYMEWVCPEHTGYARKKFVQWWQKRAAYGCPIPTTAGDAVELASNGMLAKPEKIKLRFISGQKYGEVVDCTIGQRPEIREPGDDTAEINRSGGLHIEHFDDGWDDIPF